MPETRASSVIMNGVFGPRAAKIKELWMELFGVFKKAVILSAVTAFSFVPVYAREITYSWDEETRTETLRRKVPTAINVYTDGTAEDITHEEGELDGVIYDILRVNPSEHTRVQVDYNEVPQDLDQLSDPEILDQGFLYAGGINGGYFSTATSNYGQPVGAVRRNNEWTAWYRIKNTPAYGNGFATAYIDHGNLALEYHGWADCKWNGDDLWDWQNGYKIDAEYAISGSYTWFKDGVRQDITGGAHGGIDYRTYGRAVTILAQKKDRQFLLITIFGSLDDQTIGDFLERLDVYNALRLDGGGSTQMVYETDLVKEYDPELSDTKITEAKEEEPEAIGYVSVHVDQLRVRSRARTDSAARGYAENGETYRVFEITEDNDYTWYRIGRNRWIAGTDEWVSYQDAEEKAALDDEVKKMKVTVLVDNLNIRSGPGISSPIVGKAVNGKTYDASEKKNAYGYVWYCIGENEWIADSGSWVNEE